MILPVSTGLCRLFNYVTVATTSSEVCKYKGNSSSLLGLHQPRLVTDFKQQSHHFSIFLNILKNRSRSLFQRVLCIIPFHVCSKTLWLNFLSWTAPAEFQGRQAGRRNFKVWPDGFLDETERSSFLFLVNLKPNPWKSISVCKSVCTIIFFLQIYEMTAFL